MPFLVVVGDPDATGAVGVLLDGGNTIDVGQHAGALGRPDLKQLLHARQTGGDVGTGDTSGVERTHGELGARLADALGGDDAHGLADFHQLARSGQPSVAHLADAARGLAGQRRPHRNAVDAGFPDLFGDGLVDHFVAVNDYLSAGGIGDHVAGRAAHDAFRQSAEVVIAGARFNVEGFSEFAVVVANDYLLRHVHQAAGQVTAVGGAQRGVRQTLASPVGGDEVLQGGQPLTEA